MKRRITDCFAALASAVLLMSCGEAVNPVTTPPVSEETVEIDRTVFAKGADVSWLTQMESEGAEFYTSGGQPMECMRLLRDECGVNSIRLRVWVNPVEGWNNVDDVLIKARRANDLGMRVMIDFHFSDTWADPGNQITPAAWASLDLNGLTAAMVGHINDMLGKLRRYDIEPEWVQLGNETRGGMMYPLGEYTQNFTALVNAGYDAVKAVFPEAKVIVHIDSGQRADLYTRIFGTLKAKGGKYDMIGVSLYPEPDTWKTTVDACLDNIRSASSTYGKPVMICETGMDYTEAETCNEMLSYLMEECGKLTMDKVCGIFYWEPQSSPGYNGGYSKGCFVDGAPTEALDAFK